MNPIHQETIKLMRMIFDRLFDNVETDEAYNLCCTLYDVMEYVLRNNCEELEEIYKKLNRKNSKTS